MMLALLIKLYSRHAKTVNEQIRSHYGHETRIAPICSIGLAICGRPYEKHVNSELWYIARQCQDDERATR